MKKSIPIFEYYDSFQEIKDVESELIFGERIEAPNYSIMIPTYNRPRYLKETIKSAITQDIENLEIVIVDNSEEINKELLSWLSILGDRRVCYIRNEHNIGMMGNWNRCLELAKSNWVLILHDDDTIDDDYLSKMKYMTENIKDISLIGCYSKKIDENGHEIEDHNTGMNKIKRILTHNSIVKIELQDFYINNILPIVGTVINRKKALSIGGFDNRFYPYSDAIFILKMIEKFGNCYILQNRLLNYRVAVNESLNTESIIAFVFGNFEMNCQLQEREQFVSKKKAAWLCDCMLKTSERGYIRSFGKKNEQILWEEFELINSELRINERSNISLCAYKLFIKLHTLTLALYRRERIKFDEKDR